MAVLGEVGDGRCGDHAGKTGGNARAVEASGEAGGDLRAAFPRVHPDEDLRALVEACDQLTESAANRKDGFIVEGMLSCGSSDAVGAEELPGHCFRTKSKGKLKSS